MKIQVLWEIETEIIRVLKKNNKGVQKFASKKEHCLLLTNLCITNNYLLPTFIHRYMHFLMASLKVIF